MVEGWPVVVPKGEFSVDELILFFEIDSFIPFDDKRYESYRSSHTSARLHGEKGWIVQTVVLAGHVSQGMVFRIDDRFPEVDRIKEKIDREGDYDNISLANPGLLEILSDVDFALVNRDLTGEFRVETWTTFCEWMNEPEFLPLRKEIELILSDHVDGGVDLGRPPSFLPNTKLERAQNLPDLWKTHRDTEFEITELLDGMPISVYRVNEDGPEYMKLPGVLLDDRHFRKRSGSGISIGDHDFGETEESRSWTVVRRQRIIDAMGGLLPGSQMVLAGVLCGVGISGNPHQIGGRRFYVYSISDASCMERFTMEEADEWRRKLRRTFQLVPAISRRIRLSAFAQSIDDLMMKAEGGSFVTHERQPPKRKGLVFRALDGSLRFKAVSNEWLLGETEKLREMGEDTRRRPGPNDCV